VGVVVHVVLSVCLICLLLVCVSTTNHYYSVAHDLLFNWLLVSSTAMLYYRLAKMPDVGCVDQALVCVGCYMRY